MSSAIVPARSRLKREERRRTKHDSAFSPWKVLVGPSDWEDHAKGKEGVERYRTENLPNCTSCTGVYELGVAVWHHRNGRDSSKLDPDFIIPVYLGKADNVRNRMQQYGREGAHLENGNSNGKLSESNKILAQTGLGLFREVFSKGFSIVYRWAPMENLLDAEKTESDLLDKFDYAWNKGSNGSRRSNDILKKLKRVSKTSPFLAKLQPFPQKREGIKIKVYKSPSLENGLDFYSNLEANGLLHRIFKFGRSQPRLVVRSSGTDEKNHTSICGVALGHGVICKRPPTQGNKRCAEHKGMKVNGFSSKLLTPACGVILDDGSSCTSIPLQGNKRCLEHKGRRIKETITKSFREEIPIKDCSFIPSISLEKSCPTCGAALHNNGDCSCLFGSASAHDHDYISQHCGAVLQNGSFCSRKPTQGNKRCWQHCECGMKKVNSNPGNNRNNKETYASFGTQHGKLITTCGAPLRNGSHCRRRVTGGGICWQHGGG